MFKLISRSRSHSDLRLPRQGSNLDSSDPESDVLPITPRGNGGTKIKNSAKSENQKHAYLPAIFAQESLSVTVRLNTRFSLELDLSTQKYPKRSN